MRRSTFPSTDQFFIPVIRFARTRGPGYSISLRQNRNSAVKTVKSRSSDAVFVQRR